MLRDKIKDSKTKQKIDLIKSAQNLSYLLQPHNKDGIQSLRTVIQANQIDPVETVYDKQFDETQKQYFLKTKHNQLKKNGEYFQNYRSPYTNKYYPALIEKQGIYPSPLVRTIEEKGHIMFSQYAKMYYGPQNCIANFFVEENEEDFCFAFYVQKSYSDDKQGFKGIWSSTNVAEIKGDPSKNIAYRVTTSVIYELQCSDDNKSQTSVSGSLKRIKNDNKRPMGEIQIDEFHLMMMGKMVQENQTFLRQQIQSIYIRKTKDIIEKTRTSESNSILEQRKKFNKSLFEHQIQKIE